MHGHLRKERDRQCEGTFAIQKREHEIRAAFEKQEREVSLEDEERKDDSQASQYSVVFTEECRGDDFFRGNLRRNAICKMERGALLLPANHRRESRGRVALES